MKGPLSRIRRRKPADDAASAPETEVMQAGAADPAPADDPAATAVLQPTQQPEHVPAGAEVAAPEGPSFRDRGRYRRRLRYLRRVRELGFRDLGGLVFDLHRFGREGEELVRSKLSALGQVDSELRALERALDDRRNILELREPGIAACPRCGALHGSDARFCPSCGVPFSGPRAVAEVGEGGVQSVGEIGTVVTSTEPPSTPIEPAGSPAAADRGAEGPGTETDATPDPGAAPAGTDASGPVPSGHGSPGEAASPPAAGAAEAQTAAEEPPADAETPAPVDAPTTEQPALQIPDDEPAAGDPNDWLPGGVQPAASGEAGADEGHNGAGDASEPEPGEPEVTERTDRDA